MARYQTGQEKTMDCKSHNLNMYNIYFVKQQKQSTTRHQYRRTRYFVYLGVYQWYGYPVVYETQRTSIPEISYRLQIKVDMYRENMLITTTAKDYSEPIDRYLDDHS